MKKIENIEHIEANKLLFENIEILKELGDIEKREYIEIIEKQEKRILNLQINLDNHIEALSDEGICIELV